MGRGEGPGLCGCGVCENTRVVTRQGRDALLLGGVIGNDANGGFTVRVEEDAKDFVLGAVQGRVIKQSRELPIQDGMGALCD